jgi:hypothetical protein
MFTFLKTLSSHTLAGWLHQEISPDIPKSILFAGFLLIQSGKWLVRTEPDDAASRLAYLAGVVSAAGYKLLRFPTTCMPWRLLHICLSPSRWDGIIEPLAIAKLCTNHKFTARCCMQALLEHIPIRLQLHSSLFIRSSCMLPCML